MPPIRQRVVAAMAERRVEPEPLCLTGYVRLRHVLQGRVDLELTSLGSSLRCKPCKRFEARDELRTAVGICLLYTSPSPRD